MSLVKVEHLKQQYLDKVLYDDANMQVNEHEHVGIVGPNGVGKSTLINILTGQVVPDAGQITWKKNLTKGYLDQYANLIAGQTIHDFLATAFQDLLDQAQALESLYQQMATTDDEELFVKAGTLQNNLETQGYYEIDSKIEQVAQGLGIDQLGYDHDVSQLSGGQRSKLILAKLLLEQPDMLILDEPTNYLDTAHIQWLANYLRDLPSAFIVVSHDYQFLNQIVNVVCDIEMGKIKHYTGTLTQAMRQKAADQKTYLKAYTKQQQHIAKTKEYIQKNKAGSRSKSARSREKQLSHLHTLTPPSSQTTMKLQFNYVDNPSQTIIQANNLIIGYQSPLIKQQLNFTIRMHDKVAITGFNGIGKTTLLKTILGIIPPITGTVDLNPNIKIAYYEQNLYWNNPKMVPVDIVQNHFPDETQKVVRQTLARTGLTPQQVMTPVNILSGGEQVKVKLALLMLQEANVLILDEPTNHLDDNSKNSLRQSLKDYQGTVILITHEQDFYDSSWINTVINIEKNV
ncbi:ABC-F family ATP-binding cassette domain-containing protein [Bombilactobacillus thymidiniphilus]|uniref:ATP-binding cassette domain-containing protein n=1 Tax=Bombilactobacillus thymidiniphilus TaxID=2923363 RepID=A0ABY4PEQ1_9LACO|nr:ABC-F family ATP-binding cassette domain-containing protein [Bombilactobacillus thymidiniphilus]UQS84215.1 ATP-binding cassette domain-containing protein [Bombilactobacillus thymidiniphilus]